MIKAKLSTSPQVTVLMPVYNAERYLRPAIDSILTQTYKDFEFLIVNDGSTDSSREIITAYSDPRIRLVDNECNLGQTATLNYGLSLARGRLVARQDADDISLPQRLEKQLTFLHHDPNIALLGTQGYIIDQASNCLNLIDVGLDHVSLRWRHFFDNSFIHSSVMFHKDIIWDKFGGYRENFSYCQDFDLWSRVLQHYPAANLRGRLVKWRTHSTSMTINMQEIGIAEGKHVMRRNLETTFGSESLSQPELDLIFDFKYNPERVYSRTFFDLFGRLLVTYQRLYPEAVVSRSFRDTVAEQYSRLAYGLLISNPGFVLQVLGRGFGYSPKGLFVPAWRRSSRLLSRAALSIKNCKELKCLSIL